MESVECEVKTKFSKHTYDFRWSLEDYPKSPCPFLVRSPTFHPVKDLSFHAIVERDVSGSLEFSFVLDSEADVGVIHKSFSITDPEGKSLDSRSDVVHNYRRDYAKRIICKNALTDRKALIYKCKMELHIPSNNIVPKYLMPSQSEASPTLVEDLKAMYANSLHADLCLKVGDTKDTAGDATDIFVHKGILCARSPVFAKMFESPMDEKKENVVPITDIELPVVEGLLEFLYTGVLANDDFDFVHDLYYAADKYAVSSLLKTCADVLKAKLSIDNACRVLSLADRHSDDKLKDAVMEFIQFHFDSILQTNTWSVFLDENTKLAADVMRCRSQNPKKVQPAVSSSPAATTQDDDYYC